MRGWNEIQLGELISIKHGWAFKGDYFAPEGEKIIVTPGNFIEEGGFRVREGKEKFYLGKFPNEYLLKQNDLVIAMTEQGPGLLGSPGIIPKSNKFLHNQRIGLIEIIQEDQIDKKFLYYLFFTGSVRNKIFGSATGTKVKHTAPKRIYNIEVNLPPITTQRHIAFILSAYDDLIENNLKRIKLLEELAQRTYEEWFVKFTINGEKLEVNNETGLPEGWERRNLLEVSDIRFGYPFKANQFNNKGLGTTIIRIRNIPSSITSDFTTEIVDEKYLVKTGDLLVGMDGEFYINNWSGPKAYLVQRSCNIQPKQEILKGYLSQAIVHPIKYFEATISGATVAHLGKKHLETIDIIIPNNEELFVVFNEWLNLKLNLSLKNRLLKESRDILLPRLMSGEISVEEAEVEMSIAAEPIEEYLKKQKES